MRLDKNIVWPYHKSMATVMIKTTYSLDVDTIRALESLARTWAVSKSEALRRAIKAVAGQELAGVESDGVQALGELQQTLGLNADKARRWEQRIRSERRSSAQQREGRTR